MQKPVGEASQPGQQPRIPFFPLESLLSSPSTLTENVVPAPVAPETLQADESARVVTAVVPPTDVVADAVSETVVQAGKEGPVAEQAVPVEITMVEEAVPVVQEAPAEVAIMEEVVPVVQEVTTDSPAQEVTADPTIAVQIPEP